jgi:uncharacterized protein (DUF433 family)
MISEHVEKRQDVFFVVGTRISLDSIVYAFREGCSPESIREDLEGLPLPHAYDAIAFYLDHQSEIDAYLLNHKEQWLDLERQGSPPSADLTARLEFGHPARIALLAYLVELQLVPRMLP